MTTPKKQSTLASLINPFTNMDPSPTLNHAVRYLSTWSGSDKVFMLTQYSSIIIAMLLKKRAEKSAGLKGSGSRGLRVAQGLGVWSGLVSDARMLYRFWGLLPIIQWMISLEKSDTQPTNKRLLMIERLQGLSMLIYYPLEHLYFLSSKSILSLSPLLLTKISLWSCRSWALYVGLQLLHLAEDHNVLGSHARNVGLRVRAIEAGQVGEQFSGEKKGAVGEVGAVGVVGGGGGEGEKRRVEEEVGVLRERKRALANEAMVNAAYMPLTLHWSLPAGLYSNEIMTGVFGTVAAIGQLHAGWRATA